jgi:F-type H+-transporting ATPase subunit epsilon
VTLQAALVVPEGELWSGPAQIVIAKTTDGDIGVLTGHSPVLGILAPGGLVRIRPAGPDGEDAVEAVVNGGFLSVADDRVSVLAREAQLVPEIDRAAVQAALDEALEAARSVTQGGEDTAEVSYYRALLHASGDGS